MWWSEFSIKQRNDKLKIDEPHWVIKKLEDIDSSDFETDLVTLQRNLDKWSKYYLEYDEVQIDHTYNNYCGQGESKHFISGIRKETSLELITRVKSLQDAKEEKIKLEEESKAKELQKKKDLLAKLKEELGENNE